MDIPKLLKQSRNLLIFTVLTGLTLLLSQPKLLALSKIDPNGSVVGVTYYGGNYSDQKKSWVIDNTNQCNRITAGEFSAASLNAIKASNCSDDNGLGYLNDIPLHNTVSFAELSNNPSAPDYSALGNLPAGSKLQINYKGRCVVAEKRDVGTGGSAVNGTQRALDLWWQTARSLNFTNGFDTMTVKQVSAQTPLTPLGSSTGCVNGATSPSQAAPTSTSSGEQSGQSEGSASEAAAKAKAKAKAKQKEIENNAISSQSAAVANLADTTSIDSDNDTNKSVIALFAVLLLAIIGLGVFYRKQLIRKFKKRKRTKAKTKKSISKKTKSKKRRF